MEKSIIDEIQKKMREFTKKNGRRPARIIIPKKREDDFLNLPPETVGDLKGKIFIEGPIAVINKIYGISVTWSDEDTIDVL